MTTLEATTKSERGLTILELLIAMAILSLTLGALASLLLASQKNVVQQSKLLAVNLQGNNAATRLAELLPSADPASVLPVILDNSETMSFTTIVGHDGNNFIAGPTITIEMEPMSGEVLNGQDDNGDGRVDESFLVLQSDAIRINLAGNVTSLRFDSVLGGARFAIDVTVVDTEGVLLSRVFRQQVTFRN